jgi:hypothetical protein
MFKLKVTEYHNLKDQTMNTLSREKLHSHTKICHVKFMVTDKREAT